MSFHNISRAKQRLLYLFIFLFVYILLLNIPILKFYENVPSEFIRRYSKNPAARPSNMAYILQPVITPEPKVDNYTTIQQIEKLYPNIPILFWTNNRHKSSHMHFGNRSCAPFPDIFSLDIDKEYWQRIHASKDVLIEVYSAYYDDRFTEPMVRVLAMVNRTYPNFLNKTNLYCQLWYQNENQPVVTPMDKSDYMWFKTWKQQRDGDLGPYLLGCSVPKSHSHKIPVVVSVVENRCDTARNMLKVIYEKPSKKKEFAVCVKGLDFLQYDISHRLVEWIEFLFLMGVDKIFFYQLEVHPRIKRVLDYYTRLNRADVRQTTISSYSPAIQFIQHMYLKDHTIIQTLNEVVQYNDCFYRNINKYEYIGILDTDEVIFPLKDKNWHDLIQRTQRYFQPRRLSNCFTARHIYFMDTIQRNETYPGIPRYMHMLQHVYRSQNFSYPGSYVKTIFSTKYVISCHNHYPISTAPGTNGEDLREDDARMQHYRKSCHKEVNCSDYSTHTVKDTSMWTYKHELVPNVNKALVNMNLIDLR